MKNVKINTKQYGLWNVSYAYATDFTIAEAIAIAAFGRTFTPRYSQYGDDQNSIYSLYSTDILDNPLLDYALRYASINFHANGTSQPVYIFSLKEDSIVSPMQS